MSANEATQEKPEDAPESAPEIPAETPAETAAPGQPAEALAADATANAEPEGEAPAPSFDLASGEDAAGVIEKLQVEISDVRDKWMRTAAEVENVRRRAQKDVENAHKRSIKNFAGDLLAVADNLQRAIASVDDATRKESPAIDNVLIGIDMTMRELTTAFERHGITPMDPLGQRFDPNFHEAMFEFEDAEQPAGTVGQVIETGYIIHGQPLRAAKVGVTKGGAKPGPAPVGERAETGVEPAAKEGEDAYAGTSAKDSGEEPGSHVDESL